MIDRLHSARPSLQRWLIQFIVLAFDLFTLSLSNMWTPIIAIYIHIFHHCFLFTFHSLYLSKNVNIILPLSVNRSRKRMMYTPEKKNFMYNKVQRAWRTKYKYFKQFQIVLQYHVLLIYLKKTRNNSQKTATKKSITSSWNITQFGSINSLKWFRASNHINYTSWFQKKLHFWCWVK